MKIAEENRKGFEIAKLIRKQDDKGVIVFITTHDHFAPISCQYLVSDLSFISKSEEWNVQRQPLTDCLAYYKKICLTLRMKIFY